MKARQHGQGKWVVGLDGKDRLNAFSYVVTIFLIIKISERN